MAESTVISPLGTPELRISLGSDINKWFSVLWLLLSYPITLRAATVGHNGSSDSGGVESTVLYGIFGGGRSHCNFG